MFFAAHKHLISLHDKLKSRISVPRFNIWKTSFRRRLNVLQSLCFYRQPKPVAFWKTLNRHLLTLEPHWTAHLCSLHHQLYSNVFIHHGWRHIFRVGGEMRTYAQEVLGDLAVVKASIFFVPSVTGFIKGRQHGSDYSVWPHYKHPQIPFESQT